MRRRQGWAVGLLWLMVLLMAGARGSAEPPGFSPLTLVEKVSVQFRAGSASVPSKAAGELRAMLARAKRSSRNLHIIVDGRDDGRGPAAARKRLAKRRADAVIALLKRQGLGGIRVEAGSAPDSPKTGRSTLVFVYEVMGG